MRSLRPTRALIDVGRLRRNAAVLGARAAPAALSAVVKADAYGHGATLVARALSDLVDAFCVATVDEGLALRSAGIRQRIMVLAEPSVEAAEACVASELEPFVETATFVDAIAKAAAERGVRAPVHLDVDTGMHRTGVPDSAAASLATRARQVGLDVVGVASHLACADGGPRHPTTQEQLTRFARVAADVAAPERHLLASAGLLLMPEARFERVRVGLALYGYHPARRDEPELAPVLRLVSRVVRLEPLSAGQAVSYGHRRRFEEPTDVATVPIGYADGVPRNAFEAGLRFVARGQALPIAGTVTMDHTMLAAPRGLLEVGDEVELLGDAVDAWEWATRLGTIPYEVLARIGPRVPREAVGVAG